MTILLYGAAEVCRTARTAAPPQYCLYNLGLYELGIDPAEVLPPMTPSN